MNNARAVPLELAFGAVLADMLKEEGISPLLWFASDSRAQSGDVHLGPFSTKNFLKWLKEKRLARIAKIHHGHLVGFTFSLNAKACARKVESCRKKCNTHLNKVTKKNGSSPSWTRSCEYVF
jgi:hypothetical protein